MLLLWNRPWTLVFFLVYSIALFWKIPFLFFMNHLWNLGINFPSFLWVHKSIFFHGAVLAAVNISSQGSKSVIIIPAVNNPTWTQIKCCVNIQNIIRIVAHFYYINQLNRSSKENLIAITYTRNSFYKFWISVIAADNSPGNSIVLILLLFFAFSFCQCTCCKSHSSLIYEDKWYTPPWFFVSYMVLVFSPFTHFSLASCKTSFDVQKYGLEFGWHFCDMKLCLFWELLKFGKKPQQRD